MAIVTSMGFLIATNLFFLTLIVVGFIRFRKPESGQLLIYGFIGLAISVYFCEYYFYGIVNDRIISLGTHVKLNRLALSYLVLFLPSIVLLTLFIIGFVYRAHKDSGEFMKKGWVGALIALLIVGVTAPSWHSPARHKAAEAEVKSNLHAIQIGLERYAIDYSGVYPERIETLIDDRYLNVFPGNPFVDQKMKNVPYGSQDFEGNFTYLPVIIDDDIVGYYLIGYGYKKTAGLDLLSEDYDDHVIIVLDGSNVHPQVLLPSVQDVILESQSSELAGS